LLETPRPFERRDGDGDGTLRQAERRLDCEPSTSDIGCLDDRLECANSETLDVFGAAAARSFGAVGLVVVVREELGELGTPFSGRHLDPLRDGGVRMAALPARQALVRDIPREDVLEDELRLPGYRRGELAPDELALLEPVERLAQFVSVAVQKEPDGFRPEDATDDRGALQRPLLRCLQQVDPRGQDALHGVGDVDVGDVGRREPPILATDDAALVDQLPDDLLHEERVALGALQDPRVNRLGEVLDLEEECHESVSVVKRERVERDRRHVPLAATPPRTPVRELGTGRTHEQHGSDDSVCELLEEVEQRRAGPVDVLDHDDGR
jgi:hypothetical protein